MPRVLHVAADEITARQRGDIAGVSPCVVSGESINRDLITKLFDVERRDETLMSQERSVREHTRLGTFDIRANLIRCSITMKFF